MSDKRGSLFCWQNRICKIISFFTFCGITIIQSLICMYYVLKKTLIDIQISMIINALIAFQLMISFRFHLMHLKTYFQSKFENLSFECYSTEHKHFGISHLYVGKITYMYTKACVSPRAVLALGFSHNCRSLSNHASLPLQFSR